VKASVQKIFAIGLSSITLLAVTFALSKIDCLLRPCVEDDASLRAMALLGIPVAIFYVVISWLTVFPAILLLRRITHPALPIFLVPALASLIVARILYDPLIDGTFLVSLRYLFPFLFLPWLMGAIVAVLLWPNTQPHKVE